MNKNIRWILLSVVWLGMTYFSYAQTITQAEYYIDADPGPGNGTSVSITSSDSVDQNFSLNVTGLETGMHVLFLRTRQDNGLWSIPEKRHFYVMDTTTKVVEELDRNIYAAEYFIDEDPGAGNGTAISFTSTKTVDQNFSLTLTDQAPGIHYLFLRTLQDDGLWSIAKRVPFFVMDTVSKDAIVFNTDIIAAEYFFDKDPGPGNGIALPLQKGDSVGNRPWSASTEGLEVGRHWLYIRAQSEDGIWNVVKRKEVFIFNKDCLMPQADFTFDSVAVNTTVGLTDLSTNVQSGAKYQWDVLGDGTIEGDSSVFDTSFSSKGVFPIKLTVTNPDGCFTSKVKDVYVTDGFPSDITLSANDSLFVGDTVTLTAPSGFTYKWNTGATTSSIDVMEAGIYYAWLSDGNITYRSKKVEVSYFNPIQATITTFDASNGMNNGVASISELETDGLPYNIMWSNGSSNITQVKDLPAGSYSVNITTALEDKVINFIISTRTDTTGIIAAEYFINSDPGPGNGTALNIPQGNSISYNIEINTAGFSAGVNKLYLRTKQANGLWGIVVPKTFYVIDSASSGPLFTYGGDIVYAEYAIDTMPSVGNAIPITLTATGQLIDQALAVDISNLAVGDHKLYIRTRDSNGNWSFEAPKTFKVCNSVPTSLVVSDTTICKGTNLTYSINGSAGTYNWYNENMELIKSSVDTFHIAYNVTDSALYYVSQLNAEGCESAPVAFNVKVKDPQIYAGNDFSVSVYADNVKIDTSIPKGGSWTAVSNYFTEQGVFNPSYAGVGTYQFTYSYDTLNCTATDQIQIEVVDTPVDSILVVQSGSDWKVSATELTGWETMGFSDSTWAYVSSPSPHSTATEYFTEKAPTMWSTTYANTIWLRKTFTMRDSISVDSAFIKVLVDDDHDLYINGNLIYTDNNGYANEMVTDITAYLRPGQENLIAIKALDYGSYAAAGVYLKAYVSEGMPEYSPDLLVENSAFTNTLFRATDTYEVSTTIGNGGSGESTEPFSIEYYLSVDSTFSGEDNLLLSATNSNPIPIGGNVIVNYIIDIPDTTPETNYYLITVLDRADSVQEEIEGNNEHSLAFTVQANQPPVLNDQIFSVDENSPNGTYIGTIAVTDPENDPLKGYFASGNETNAFYAIDTTGALYIGDSAQFDFEVNPSFALVVGISDGIDTTFANITVNVNDVQEVSPLEADSLALVALYNSTGGESWSSKTGWLVDNLSVGWEGVILKNGRVSEISLPSNGLTGAIPVDINKLDSLTVLDLSNNELTDLPDLTSMTILSSVNLAGNKLTFEDLEPNAMIEGVIYSPQDSIGVKEYVQIPVHSDSSIYVDIGGSANIYQWYYNGNPVGSDSASYTISNITRSNMGAYHVEVTNSLVPNLIISSYPDDIMAEASVSGVVSDDAGNIVQGNGEVILMAIRASGAYDTLETPAVIQSDGSYLFEDVLLQDYIAIAVTDTVVYPNLLPTYYAQSIFWEEADTLFLETNTGDVNFAMVTFVEEPLGGEGIISGYVDELIESLGGRIAARKRVKNANVSVRRGRRSGKKKLVDHSRMLEDLELVSKAKTNENGEFSFTQLTDDIYYLNVQYPGYPMDETSFIEIPIGNVTGGRVVAHKDQVEVEALVAEGKITVTQINVTHVYADELFSDILVYPNPASTHVNIDLSAYSSDFKVELYAPSGKLISRRESASEIVNLELHNLQKGMYYLRIFSGEKLASSFKLIIN